MDVARFLSPFLVRREGKAMGSWILDFFRRQERFLTLVRRFDGFRVGSELGVGIHTVTGDMTHTLHTIPVVYSVLTHFHQRVIGFNNRAWFCVSGSETSKQV